MKGFIWRFFFTFVTFEALFSTYFKWFVLWYNTHIKKEKKKTRFNPQTDGKIPKLYRDNATA